MCERKRGIDKEIDRETERGRQTKWLNRVIFFVKSSVTDSSYLGYTLLT